MNRGPIDLKLTYLLHFSIVSAAFWLHVKSPQAGQLAK